MTLISILIGLALEYFLGALDSLRNYTWFNRYSQWLELKCSKYTFWNGPAGVLLTLALPLLALGLISFWLDSISIILSLLLAILVFVYSLGPEINTFLDSYLLALGENNEEEIGKHEELLVGDNDNEELDEAIIIQSILIRSHEHLFGIIFWFILLGMTGALLYSLVVRMNARFTGIHGGYADSIRDLNRILMWPSARLQAMGCALSGSLVEALEGWKNVEGHTLDCSEQIIAKSGLGALQYQPQPMEDEDSKEQHLSLCIQETQSLINRTLIVWLTALGVMTIGGWLS